MAVAKAPRASQLVAGVQALYVAFIEVAPWNLTWHPQGVRHKGTGVALLGTACRLSHTYGFGGRVLLSALPQAEGFYRACGMKECGTSYGMLYFEMSEADATTLRAKVRV